MRLLEKIFATGALCAALSILGPAKAFADFDVTWGNSTDAGVTTGWDQLGTYLFNQSYFADVNSAKSFAMNQYVNDPDPYFFDSNLGPYTAQILLEGASFANQNTFGYYTGTGGSKSPAQLFSGPDGVGASLPFDPNLSFGFYLTTPQHNVWYTDRAEQNGIPQILIYALPQKSPDFQEFLVAAEDLNNAGSSDRDFNDMWVLLSRTTVVPEPVSGALFLMGGGALAARRLRKKKSQDPGAASS